MNVTYQHAISEIHLAAGPQAVVEDLNARSDEGWEMVSTTTASKMGPTGPVPMLLVFFRRPSRQLILPNGRLTQGDE